MQNSNNVIVHNTKTISKRVGESELGNLLADALLAEARTYSKQNVDFALVHLNEIHLPQLEQGDITVEKVYELLPSDNQIILLQLDGEAMKALFDYMAKGDGVPVAGVRYEIREQQWRNLEIGGKPFDRTQRYILAISDYWVNEIDELKFLKSFLSVRTNKWLRDAVLDYFKEQKTITGKKDGRLTVMMRH